MGHAPVRLLAIASLSLLLSIGVLSTSEAGEARAEWGWTRDGGPSTEGGQTTRADNASPNNTPPTFLDFNVTPREGDADTLFTFIANVTDPDGDDIQYVLVDLGNGMFFAMDEAGNSSGVTTFSLQKKVPNGRFKVVFEAKDARGAKNSTLARPLDLLVKKYSKEETDYLRYLCIATIIATTIILMIITFRYFQQRRKALAKPDDGEPDMRVTCSNCGKAVEEDERSCPHCKEPLEGEEQLCPFCKTRVPEGASVCPLCKKRFSKEPPKPKEKLACPDCGAVVDDLKGLCPGCGKDLGKKGGLTTVKGKKAEKKGDAYMCSHCGGEAREGDRKCPRCGVVFK